MTGSPPRPHNGLVEVIVLVLLAAVVGTAVLRAVIVGAVPARPGGWLPRWARRASAAPARRSGRGPDEPVLSPGDVVELDELFARAHAEHSHEVDVLLAARLQPLVRRSVPVRAIRPAPGPHAVRICFADGTVVLARGHTPGDLGMLAFVLRSHAVRLESCQRDETGTQLVFRWTRDRSLGAVAVGLDQA